MFKHIKVYHLNQLRKRCFKNDIYVSLWLLGNSGMWL